MADLCRILSVPEISGRQTVDKTGLTGMFDIRLPGPGNPFDQMRGAVEKLGLNLEPAKARTEFLFIDRIERPSEN